MKGVRGAVSPSEGSNSNGNSLNHTSIPPKNISSVIKKPGYYKHRIILKGIDNQVDNSVTKGNNLIIFWIISKYSQSR